jgi:thiol:disulfide interchange protein
LNNFSKADTSSVFGAAMTDNISNPGPGLTDKVAIVSDAIAISPRTSAEPSPRIRLEVPHAAQNGHEPSEQIVPQLPPAALQNYRFPSGQENVARKSSQDSRILRAEFFKPRKYHKWKSPLLISMFFVLGLGLSITHCALYAALNGTIVGSSWQQENNLR